MNLDDNVIERLMSGVVTLDDVARIVQADLPMLTDAQLARLLGDIYQDGPTSIAQVIEPLARAEMARRRAVQRTLAPGASIGHIDRPLAYGEGD